MADFQAVGMLAGAIKPGDQAAGTGLTAIAAQGDLELQAQADRMEVAAKSDVSIQSQSTRIDWAAARKITLSTAAGANITIEGGNITVQCPGTITIRAATKSFVGPEWTSYALPELAKPGGFSASSSFDDFPTSSRSPIRNTASHSRTAA